VPLPEKALIAKIRTLARSRRLVNSRTLLTGIGDDCAVLRLSPGQDTLVTTDFSLETIHFRREWHPPESVGHRCLVRGLSDIAGMGGEPTAAFLSLALPRDLAQAWVAGFLRGFTALAERYKVPLAGGDTAQSPHGILADIIVLGSVPKGKALLRSGARPGDRIYVSGELGGSAAAVKQMLHKPNNKLKPASYPRHFYPEPRLALGRFLRERGLATAMIDTSDGLSTDLAHICEESGVGAEIAAQLIPRAHIGQPDREVSLELALHGGEDYELLFSAPPSKRLPGKIAGSPITSIGVITRGPGIFIREAKGGFHRLTAGGWEHFRK
jgi:thiamine-monophosphate kinase